MDTKFTGFFTESDLIQKAASSRNVTLENKPRECTSHPEFDSKSVGEFKLDEKFLAALKKHGFTFNPGTESPYDTMMYLAGHSNQRGAHTFESDCWAWDKEETKHLLTISFRLSVSERKRGVICEPRVWGNCRGGAVHKPTINRFVKATAEHFKDANSLVGAAVNPDGQAVISWSDLGVGGIKSVELLFDELYGKNENVAGLARSSMSPFAPSPPYSSEYALGPVNRLFVPEAGQPALFSQWKKQLQDFQSSLR